MADVEEQDIDRLLANPPEKVEIEVKYKMPQRSFLNRPLSLIL